MENNHEPKSRVGEPINYDVFLTHTMYPTGEKKDHDAAKSLEEIKKEVLNWRKETNNY